MMGDDSLFESVLLMYELPVDEAELLVRECSDAVAEAEAGVGVSVSAN